MQWYQIEICVTFDALEEDVDAVVDMDLALFDRVCTGLGLVVVTSIRDVPKRVYTMYVMIHIKDGGISVVAKSPSCVFQFGHGRGINVHLDKLRTGYGVDSCELPFIPCGISSGIGLLTCNRYRSLGVVKGAVDLLRTGSEIKPIHDRAISGCATVVGIAKKAMFVEPDTK